MRAAAALRLARGTGLARSVASDRSIGAALVAMLVAHSAGAPPARGQAPPAVACEVLFELGAGGGVTIRGRITAATPVAGSYRLEAAAAAGSRASQSAPFTATPDAPATVGTVALAGAGPVEVTLAVTSTGGTATCSRRIDGR